MIKMNKKEAHQLVDLLSQQVEKAAEGSEIEIEILPHNMSVTVHTGNAFLRSGIYRSSFKGDPLKVAIAQSVEAGKKLRKELANK